MKILIVGSGSEYAIELHFLKHMNDGENKATIFKAQDMFLQYYQKRLFNKVLFRLGYKTVYTRINQHLKEIIAAESPDVLFVFKGMEVLPETLRWAKGRGIFLANYNPDNPFLFSGSGSGNSNVTKSIHLFDLHFTYDEKIAQQLRTVTTVAVRLLPFGFESGDFIQGESANTEETKKLCFVGNPDKNRADFLSKLADNDIEIDVYGANWKKFISHRNITVFDTVYRAEYWRVIKSYRVQLNLMRPHNPESHNMRTFEVPGVGGILLAPQTADHKNFFVPGEEIFLYNDVSSCVVAVRHLLALSEEESAQIRAKARQRSVLSGYSYFDRSKQVLNCFSELLHERN